MSNLNGGSIRGESVVHCDSHYGIATDHPRLTVLWVKSLTSLSP
jgi:hypothetical protein